MLLNNGKVCLVIHWKQVFANSHQWNVFKLKDLAHRSWWYFYNDHTSRLACLILKQIIYLRSNACVTIDIAFQVTKRIHIYFLHCFIQSVSERPVILLKAALKVL